MKRTVMILMALCIAVAVFAGGQQEGAKAASGYPVRPIEVLVPSNPGSTSDMAVRMMQPFLEKHLGVPVVVVNLPGSNGTIWMLRVKDAAPDGYTWGVWTLGNIAAESVMGQLVGKYDASKDVVYAGLTYIAPNAVISSAKQPWNNLGDLAAAARANPGKITWARKGPVGNNADHIREFMNSFPGAEFTIIEGSFAADARSSLMGGHIDIMTDFVSSSMDLLKEGYIKILGVGGSERLAVLPDVATYGEQGYEFTNANSEWGWMAPVATPKEIVDIFSAALEKAANEPEYKKAVEATFNPWIWKDGPETYQTLLGYFDFYRKLVAQQAGK